MDEFVSTYWWVAVLAFLFLWAFIQWLYEYSQEYAKNKAAREIANPVAIKKLRDEYRKKTITIYGDIDEDVEAEALKYSSISSPYQGLRKECPSCENGYLRPVKGKYGAFMGCSNFPSCRYTQSISDAKQEYSGEINASINQQLKKVLEFK